MTLYTGVIIQTRFIFIRKCQNIGLIILSVKTINMAIQELDIKVNTNLYLSKNDRHCHY